MSDGKDRPAGDQAGYAVHLERLKVQPDTPERSYESASMHELLLRYQRFRDEIFPARKEEFLKLAGEQTPQVLFITCSDSRVAPDVIFQSEPGDLFVCRNVGNIIPPYGEMLGSTSAAIEFAVRVLQVKAIVICGHSDCGAMKALMHPEQVAELPTVSAWLRHSEPARQIATEYYSDLSEDEFLAALTEENIVAQISNLETHPSVASRLRRGDLEIYGWVYKIHSGEVWGLDAKQGRFVALDSSLPSATRPPRRRAAT
ncbi:MAG: carbonic anhydrase [Acidobacteriaceae bacterium]|nr:carbonic anhydrase [Acidobacteriaceae bacterium]